MLPLGILSILIIGQYYKLYVAALIYSAELHDSLGLGSHSWFEHIKEYQKSLPGDASKDNLLNRRTYGWPHSWILYSILIAILGLLSLIGGIYILWKI